MSLQLRVTYGRTADFLADVEHQVSRGGLLVRVELGDVDRGALVELELVTPAGRLVVHGSVLQTLGPAGVAVSLQPADLAALVEAAHHAPAGDGGDPIHEVVGGAAASELREVLARGPVQAAPAPVPEPESPHAHARAATLDSAAVAQQQAQKIQLALHGDKNQRMAILRENNRLLHSYVLKNPQLQLDEVVFIAKQPTVGADLLTAIAARRDWAERPEVAIAIVRNPKTPIPLAVRMLDHVGPGELRSLAKQGNVRDQIRAAARKKVVS
ncbi:MAG TPA: hypothetical protein VFQ53_25895 [Kofleriaceae bacterium]|nr:hypothetical protein [Kofleriaceae bacterium]